MERLQRWSNMPICTACGALYETENNAYEPPEHCKICEDPRQFVPAGGQSWTTLTKLHDGKERNNFATNPEDHRITSIWTKPVFAIGQRCMLISTPAGNVLWDCIALIDEETIEWILSRGGLKAIVISHPHFYTTHTVWAEVFQCPVYTAHADQEWLNAKSDRRQLIEGKLGTRKEILPKVEAILCGGHFPGSMCLSWGTHLFCADTLFIVRSSHNPDKNRSEKTTSFSFMWSVPNMIPMHPDDIHGVWKALKSIDFKSAHGLVPPAELFFSGAMQTDSAESNHDVTHPELKNRLLQSMKIQLKNIGYDSHPLMSETL